MSGHTPGPWEWWTSNSWKRLRSNPSNGRDAGVAAPFVSRDGHADLEVSAADMTLIAAAPDLLALAHQYATECGDCAGTRVCPDDEPCTECADIWRVIDKAEGRT